MEEVGIEDQDAPQSEVVIDRRYEVGEGSDRSLVIIGRIVTFIAMIAAILWSPFVSHFQSIFQGIVSIICYIAPPITVVFLCGVFWKKASSLASIITLWCGSAMGLTVFLLDWFKEYTGWNIPSMMTTFYLVVICFVIMVAVSLWKPHSHTKESQALVWNHPVEALKGNAWRGIGNYRFLAGLLFVTMIVLYAVFS